MNFAIKSSVRIPGVELIRRAKDARDRNLRLRPLPIAGTFFVPVWLSADAHAKFREVAENHSLTIPEAIAGLAQAWFAEELKSKNPEPEPDPINRKRLQFHREMRDGILSGQIVLAEGSTGIGKGRILAKTARDVLAANPSHRVWVAAPTFVVLDQLLGEFTKVEDTADLLGSPAILFGRQVFVSKHAVSSIFEAMRAEPPAEGELRDGLSDDEIDSLEAKVEDWFRSGAQPRTPGTRALGRRVQGVSHLLEDFLSLLPEGLLGIDHPFQRAWLTADSDESDPAVEVRHQMHERAASARLVFLTHIMLAWQHRSAQRFEKAQENKGSGTRKTKDYFAEEDESSLPLLARCTHLLVDEAHELESAFAQVFSGGLSLKSLRSWINSLPTTPAREKTAEAVDNLITLLRSVQSAAEAGGRKVLNAKVPIKETEKVIAALSSTLKSVAATRSRSKDLAHAAKASIWEKEIQSFLSFAAGGVHVQFSRKLHFPQIMSGRSSVDQVLQRLWRSKAGAGLVSGTVFTPLNGGREDSAYMEAKLGIPRNRARILGPFTAPWVINTPTLFRPSDELLEAFSYRFDEQADDSESSDETARWQSHVAEAIHFAAKSSKGGMLVLATSYADIKALHKHLSSVLKDRLLVQQSGDSMGRLKEEFISLRRSGVKPVWLATGSAWRGLNLSDDDKSPEDDFLLTDLAILRCPWNSNRSFTHLARTLAAGSLPEMSETAFQLRQGLGRLVRRAGLLHRRIWMLDGRLWSPIHPRSRTMLSVMANYRTNIFSAEQLEPYRANAE
jgi:ATP-dependent DNA helicase DinG